MNALNTTDTASSAVGHEEALKDARKYLLKNYGRADRVMVRGSGCRLWDAEGRCYLDFGGGVAVCALGHSHPVMVNALNEQGATLIHCSNLYQIPQQIELAKFLVENVMESAGKVFFCNSGAEANETLIKAARKFGQLSPSADGTPRTEILTFSKSFHGRTMAGISATAQAKIHDGFGPLLPGFTYVPFNDVAALKAAINPGTVAILFEPIQGEGGIHLASPEFLETVQEICDEKQLLLMLDEVQCGLGRAGHFCGWKTLEGGGVLQPNLVAWAKGIAGGFPMGAVWITDEKKNWQGEKQALSALLGPGSHGSTYGGSPLASAVALSVLKELEAESIPAHVAAMEERIRGHFAAGAPAFVSDLRGKGLMLGFVLDEEKLKADCPEFAELAAEGATASAFLMGKLMDVGLLTVPAGADVVRWLPPLIVSESEIDEAWNLFTSTLKGLTQ